MIEGGDIVINWSTTDIAGLEFGDTHIAAARLRDRGQGAYLITHAGWVEYNPAASLREKAESVKALWRTTKMPTRTVCAALRSGSMVVRSFSVPAMTGPEVTAVLDLQAEEALQLARQEMVVEWHLNSGSGSTAEKPDTLTTGIYAAAPLKDVQCELELLHAADLDPVILDIRALAVANLRAALMGTGVTDYPLCLVNVSPHSADIILQHAPGVIYPHTVYCRASTWAESPKFLAENIRDVMRYGEYKLGWSMIGRVVMVGQIEEGSALISAVQEFLNVEVEVWEPWTVSLEISQAVGKLIHKESRGGGILVPALGLALRKD